MEPIFYDEAIELLDISMDTLRHGVTRKVLTPLPRQGQRQRLIKEQVLLFKGKRLSFAALTPQERKTWSEYATLAVTDTGALSLGVVREIARQEARQEGRQEARNTLAELLEKWMKDVQASTEVAPPKQSAAMG